MRFAKSDGCAVAIMLGLIFNIMPLTPVAAEDPYKAQIDALRKAMEKYKDYKVAVRDLYLSTVGCVHYSGEKMAGHMHYPKGTMGIHFVNLTIRGRARSDETKHFDIRTRRQGAAAGGG
jgi:hypothetical protein